MFLLNNLTCIPESAVVQQEYDSVSSSCKTKLTKGYIL